MVNLILTKTIDSKYILERAAKDFKESGGKAKQLFIVPDRIGVSYQMMVLEALGLEGSTNIEVLSFRNLADKVLGKRAKKALNQQMETMLVRKVIEDSKKDFKYYQKSAQYPGFAQEAIRLITTLRTNRVNPERLDDLIEHLDAKYVNKVHDIKLLLSNYISALGEHVDYVSKLALLKDAIHDWYTEEKKVDFNFYDYDIYVSEFFGFSEVELGILEELFNNSTNRNYVTLPYSKSDNSYIFPNYLKEKFEVSFTNLKIEEYYKEEKLVHKEYEQIQSSLFGYEKIEKANEESKVVHVQTALNIEKEVKNIASQIKLLVKNGCRYKDIACVCCDTATYKEVLESILKKYDIPYFTDVKAPLLDQNITKILMYALKVKINHNFSQADVFALIKELGNTLASRENINLFENYCLRRGIDRAYKFEKEFLDDKNIEAIRAKLINYLMPLDFSEAIYVKDIIACIKKFLEGIKADKICERLAKEQQDKGYAVESSITTQSYKKLMDILDQFADENLIGNCKLGKSIDGMSQEVFYKIFEATIMSQTITTIPMYIDCVYIGDLQKSRYESKKYIFVFGANEGIFPQEVQDNSLLSMQDLNEWEEKGEITIYPTVKDSNKEAKLNALMALLKAQESVFISYPIQDTEGERLQPAKSIDTLCAISGRDEPYDLDEPSNDWTIKDYERFVGASNNALESLIAINNRIKNSLVKDEGVCKQVRNALYQIAVKDIGKGKVDDILKGDHTIDQDIKSDITLLKDSINPSRIETYLGCPFRYYMQYILSLKERDEFGVDVADTGNIVHKCLEEFFTKKEEDYKKMTPDDVTKFVADVVLKEIDSHAEYKYLGEKEFDIVRNDLINETAWSIRILVDKMEKSEFRPYKLEAKFGDKPKEDGTMPEWKPLVLDLGDGSQLKLNGIIDRIDVDKDKDNVVIIDYKSKSLTSAAINVDDVVYGNKIQIILYLKKVCEESGMTPAGAFYLPLATRVSKDTKEDKVKYVGFITNDADVVHKMQTDIEEVFDEVCKTKTGRSRIANGRLFPIKEIFNTSLNAREFVKSDYGQTLSKEETKAILDYVEKLSINAAKEIKEGYIKIAPMSDEAKESKRCKYCPYKAICNIEKHPEKIRVLKGNAKDLLEVIKEGK